MKNKILSLVLILSLVVVAAVIAGCVPATETPTGGEEGTTTSGGITGYLPMIIIAVLLVGMFYFLMIRPMRQREKKHDQMVEQLHVGDKVITAGGIYGEIKSISEDSVILKIESGATMRVTKGSIVSLPSAEGRIQ
ncbi:MAG: preprotein translocase subunit YajC [Dehalococcoidales bacterium]|nr:preprotein translocase subunit YajC [Dehalococcoidales bacterium]